MWPHRLEDPEAIQASPEILIRVISVGANIPVCRLRLLCVEVVAEATSVDRANRFIGKASGHRYSLCSVYNVIIHLCAKESLGQYVTRCTQRPRRWINHLRVHWRPLHLTCINEAGDTISHQCCFFWKRKYVSVKGHFNTRFTPTILIV